METENLDCMSEEELTGLEQAYLLLSLYAKNKREALIRRKDGRIVAAQAYERQCDGLYARLPKNLKW